MSIYDNTSAFGLMSPEDQAAMQDYFTHDAGEIVYYSMNGRQWSRTCTPSWSFHSVYRAVKPEPKPITVLAPDHMPDWDEVWIAADEYGEVWCYDDKPECRDSVWVSRGAEMAQLHLCFRLADRGTVDWDKSLICFRGPAAK